MEFLFIYLLFIISVKSPHKTLKRYNAGNIIQQKNIFLGYIRNILNPGQFLTKISDGMVFKTQGILKNLCTRNILAVIFR